MTFVFALTGVLMIAFALPLMRRAVAPNRIYGVCTRATLQDRGVWYEANARTGRDLLVLGLVQVGVALGLSAIQSADTTSHAVINVAVLLSGGFAVIIIGWRRANRLSNAPRSSQ